MAAASTPSSAEDAQHSRAYMNTVSGLDRMTDSSPNCRAGHRSTTVASTSDMAHVRLKSVRRETNASDEGQSSSRPGEELEPSPPTEYWFYRLFLPNPVDLLLPRSKRQPESVANVVRFLQTTRKSFFERCFICKPLANVSSGLEQGSLTWDRTLYYSWNLQRVRNRLLKLEYEWRRSSSEDGARLTHSDMMFPVRRNNNEQPQGEQRAASWSRSLRSAAKMVIGRLSGLYPDKKVDAPFVPLWGHTDKSFRDAVMPLLKPPSQRSKIKFVDANAMNPNEVDNTCYGKAGLEVNVADLQGWHTANIANSSEVSQILSQYGKCISKALLNNIPVNLQDEDTDGESTGKPCTLQQKLLKAVQCSLDRMFHFFLHTTVIQDLIDVCDSIKASRFSDPSVFIVFELCETQFHGKPTKEEKLMLCAFPSFGTETDTGAQPSVFFALGEAPARTTPEKSTPVSGFQSRRKSSSSLSELSVDDPSKGCATPFSYDIEEDETQERGEASNMEPVTEDGFRSPSEEVERAERSFRQSNPDLLLLSKESLLCVSSVVRIGVTLALSIISGVLILLLISIPERVTPLVASDDWKRTAGSSHVGLVTILNFILLIWYIKIVAMRTREDKDNLSFRFLSLGVLTVYVVWTQYGNSHGWIDFLLPQHSVNSPNRLTSWSSYLTLLTFTIYCLVTWRLVVAWKCATTLEHLGARRHLSSLTRYISSILLVAMTVVSIGYMCLQDVRVSRLASIFFKPLISLFLCVCVLSLIMSSYSRRLSKAIAEVNDLNELDKSSPTR